MPSTVAESLRRIHVAVGVVVNENNELLIARRPQHLHQGGLWEFPGGKVEAGESVQVALRRELQEELAIEADLQRLAPLMEIAHNYSDKAVFLDVWWVRGFSGDPRGCEGQEVRWVSHRQLPDYAFPAANATIVQRIVSELEQR